MGVWRMLNIVIPGTEFYDEAANEFITTKSQSLQLEHSLVSVSKWEAKWNKSFISKNDKTEEELIDYIRCMTINQNVNPNTYKALSRDNIKQINAYIDAPMTATVFYNSKTTGQSKETVTSELIYYWMVSLNIPFECQKWHLNRLLTLVRVCNVKNTPPKKINKRELMARNRALNASRRKSLNTRG